MPLQNRADPFGELHAVTARGGMMGNRGGRFHKPDQTLGARRYVSQRWICCLCAFRGRQRTVWGESYTEIFFLDEVTALASGHRPCFECRRADALAFADRFPIDARAGKPRPGADAMDAILHRERMAGAAGGIRLQQADRLPDGAMVAIAGKPFAVREGKLLAWRFVGYGRADPAPQTPVQVLTPQSILATLAGGYRPRWHASATMA